MYKFFIIINKLKLKKCPIPNPQSPIPNPQSPICLLIKSFKNF